MVSPAPAHCRAKAGTMAACAKQTDEKSMALDSDALAYCASTPIPTRSRSVALIDRLGPMSTVVKVESIA